MNQNQILILLEILSYLFVTTDLYGSERLSKASDKIKFVLEDSNSKLKPFLKKAVRILAIILTILFFVTELVEYFSNTSEISLLNIFISVVIFIVVSVFFLPELLRRFEIISYILLAPLFALRLFLSIVIFALKKLKLEGILLVVGTILFIIVKVIAFFN